MKNLARKLAVPVTALFLLAWMMSTATSAYAGPRRRHHGPGGGTHTVAEPATLALLGVGLASLGLYAKKKRNRG